MLKQELYNLIKYGGIVVRVKNVLFDGVHDEFWNDVDIICGKNAKVEMGAIINIYGEEFKVMNIVFDDKKNAIGMIDLTKV